MQGVRKAFGFRWFDFAFDMGSFTPGRQGCHRNVRVFEDGAPPRFRLASLGGQRPAASAAQIETTRADGARQRFAMLDRGAFLESAD